ncbi:MAG TPA: nuclear transport factor 2 family protein [Candidatus Dormibacteraeota bacterium]|nr:nuclear transport factor 2 family protein [Candidatus Dormibacteraeota bacterium]
MRRRFAAAIGTSALLLATLALVLSAAAPPALARNLRGKTAPAAAMSDRAAIEALESSYVEAFDTRDVDGIMKVYARGKQLFVFDVVPPREYPSWDDYKRDWETLFSQFPGPASDKMSEMSITVVGTVAYGHHIEDSVFTQKDGTKKEFVVRVTDVYRKLKDKWLIVQEHVSFPVDVTTGQADLMSKP